uniref:Uncharacterized protein n=1 Tax=Tanacetum cinerariifolium TaxID=118510 RepID=A0A6L2NAZ1_TANCI|nr:hypothetical protein [Tanacetum cinerariifolium]
MPSTSSALRVEWPIGLRSCDTWDLDRVTWGGRAKGVGTVQVRWDVQECSVGKVEVLVGKVVGGDSVQFLGHVIDRSGVHVDPAKIKSINSWAAPTITTEKLCSASILALPEGTKEFVVYCDASLKGYEAVLMQKEKKELNLRQRRWIELLTDYDCEIRYHPGKANIHKAQEEAMKTENVKAENLGRLIKKIFEFHPDGTRCFRNLVWLSRFGGLRDLVMHGVPIIILDRDSHFTSKFQISLQEALGTNLDMSIAYHHQTDGQSERTIQMVEDMLCAYRNVDHLYAGVSRQKSYADKRTKSLKFEVGDMVLLNVSPWKGAVRFRKHKRLSLRCIGPFKIIARVVPVAYTLELPEELKGDIVVPVDEIQLDDKLHIIEGPMEIFDREVKPLKQSRIPIVKVRWNLQRGPEFTWEREDQTKKKYSHLFISKDEARKSR